MKRESKKPLSLGREGFQRREKKIAYKALPRIQKTSVTRTKANESAGFVTIVPVG